jgi:hypothetical protein
MMYKSANQKAVFLNLHRYSAVAMCSIRRCATKRIASHAPRWGSVQVQSSLPIA